MMNLCSEVIKVLAGRTLVTAESCTGGGIGRALTAVSGASAVFKGGVISYCDELKQHLLGVPVSDLKRFGAVSAPVAEAMALGAREHMNADVAVSVTGLAGPGGDEFGNPVGTVYIGYAGRDGVFSRKYLFSGSREEVRQSSIEAALRLILEIN